MTDPNARNARPRDILSTHEVTNQPDARPARSLWEGDAALRHWVGVFGGQADAVAAYGARLGSEELRDAGRQANRHPPELRQFDRGGRRLDEVVFHPAYHAQMAAGIEAGFAALPWQQGVSGGHVTHAAMTYMLTQTDPGVSCPLTMTYAAVPVLRAASGVDPAWLAGLTARSYDPSARPVTEKAGVTLGMAMTEKQGGSDLRANSTRATRDGEDWRLTGHKWFCSAPMSDGFLTLAQSPGGLSCFLVPRWLPDGTRNAISLMRLKDKLGNRSNASSEIEYEGAWAQMVGDEGAGVRTIIAMVHHTRLDTAMAPAGLMRAALAEAVWWSRGRRVFQRTLIEQPLMRRVLGDLALDREAALALGLRVAEAFDQGDDAFARIAVALAKFQSNKRCVGVIYEAMEVLGGMGYIDDTPLPMLYREAPLNSIWEGSGNVICLDILRTLSREPDARAALDRELDAGLGGDGRYDAALRAHRATWPGLPEEGDLRHFAESLAMLLAASVLLRHAPDEVSQGYCAARLGAGHGTVAGAIPDIDAEALIGRIL